MTLLYPVYWPLYYHLWCFPEYRGDPKLTGEVLCRGMDKLGRKALGRSLAAKVNIVASTAKDVSPLGFWVLLVLIACCWVLLCSRFGFAPVVPDTRRRDFGAHGESEVR